MWQPLFEKYFPLLERTEVVGGSGEAPHEAFDLCPRAVPFQT